MATIRKCSSSDVSAVVKLSISSLLNWCRRKKPSLSLPYRVLEKCTADIGRPNAKGVDIDVWLPGQNMYRETHTADYISDFQTRSMQTRVRRSNGQVELAHTNDATAFSQRPLIAIIENFQTAEGDVIVPEVLRPYMGMSGKERI